MKFQDNFELMMWFKKFVITTNTDWKKYEPEVKRTILPEFPEILKKEKKIQHGHLKITDPQRGESKPPAPRPIKKIPEPVFEKKNVPPKVVKTTT